MTPPLIRFAFAKANQNGGGQRDNKPLWAGAKRRRFKSHLPDNVTLSSAESYSVKNPIKIPESGLGSNRVMRKQLHVYFTGRVQGVGFRFTAQDIAGALGVAGWVKNLRDGRVEIVAEAEEETLKDLLERINSYLDRYIQDRDIEWLPPTGEFKDFRIRA